MRRRTPLVYLFGLMEGRYVPVWPVFVVGDDPAALSFTIMADSRDTIADTLSKGAAQAIAEEESAPRRAYITRTVQARLHQQSFRERVLAAYRNQCALCRLRYRELLDASHIMPDGHALGVPEIRNGLALCKIHHTAFDRNLIGIRPDIVVEVRADILEEEDGPMLRHGLQGMHGQRLHVPGRREHRPDREALEYRYEMFRAG
jgi:putative restriction endonuclease